jgi:hypothetical protein
MTRKLEELFDLPPTAEEVDVALALDEAIDKINDALPAVKGLDASDSEMDNLSDLAKDSYKDLMDLGMQVDSRFAAEIFSVASSMLGHAITAKTAKLDKKLKMVDLQLKKMRLDQQQAIIDAKVADTPDPEAQQGTGHILSRNELLERIISSTKQNSQKE